MDTNLLISNQGVSSLTTGDRNVTSLVQQVEYTLTSGDKNTMIGYNWGKSITEGDGNILIGEDAGYSINEGTSNICLDDEWSSLTHLAHMITFMAIEWL